jgi:DNA-directed RNA polymerase specialized sigma24 family protein
LKLSSQELQYHQSKVAYYRDEQSYKHLFLYFHPVLFRFSFNILHNKSVSEEIVSDMMLKVWEMGNKLSQIQHLKIFLITSVKNACFTYLSSKKHLQSLNESIDNEDIISSNGDNNWYVSRYADVLLMLAEALGESTQAYVYINQVRARAGLAAISATTPSTFAKQLLDERRIEFALENHRWQDLLRFGLAKSTMAKQLAVTEAEIRLLFAIPQKEIDVSNGKLVQNPGL